MVLLLLWVLPRALPARHGGQAWPCVSLATPWVSLEIQVSSVVRITQRPLLVPTFLEGLEMSPGVIQPNALAAWISLGPCETDLCLLPWEGIRLLPGALGQAWVQAASETRATR